MSKLVVDRVECLSSTDHTGDDLYFLVMRFGPDCNVHRVGPNAAWGDMECGDVRNTDVVLVENFSGEHIVAAIDEDDSYDFDAEVRNEMTRGLRLVFASLSTIEKDRGRLTASMMNVFANLIGRKRTNDDLLSVQVVSAAGKMHVVGQGAEYRITTRVV